MQTQHDRPQAVPTRADAIEDALDRLSAYDYTDGIGLATHGPMGAEALSTLGHDDLVPSWVEAYKARQEPTSRRPSRRWRRRRLPPMRSAT